jgi:hypothetical protein
MYEYKDDSTMLKEDMPSQQLAACELSRGMDEGKSTRQGGKYIF